MHIFDYWNSLHLRYFFCSKPGFPDSVEQKEAGWRRRENDNVLATSVLSLVSFRIARGWILFLATTDFFWWLNEQLQITILEDAFLLRLGMWRMHSSDPFHHPCLFQILVQCNDDIIKHSLVSFRNHIVLPSKASVDQSIWIHKLTVTQ